MALWLYMILLLVIILPLASQQEQSVCPYNGLLVLRPWNPFAFIGRTSRLCCQTIDPISRQILPWPRNNLQFNFNCPAGVDIRSPPVQATRDLVARDGSDSANNPVCVDITVTSFNQRGFCRCQVQGRPDCQGSQYLTIEKHVPRKLDFSCITYGSDNVTCVPNVPNFVHSARVTTKMYWRQAGILRRRSPTMSKVCSRYNSCALTPRNDGIMIGLPLSLNISIEMVYDISPRGPRDQQPSNDDRRVTVRSDWTTFDIHTHVKLEPPVASVKDVANTTIQVNWQRRHDYFGDKIVSIACVTDGDVWVSLNVTEKMEFNLRPLEATLLNLRPTTTYNITLVTKPIESDVWSEPTSLTATTC